MVSIVIKHNFPQVQQQLDQLERDVAVAATTSAINRTLQQGRTQMVRAITREYNIQAGVVREGLRITSARRKAGLYRIEGFLESPSQRRRSRNLIHFGAKQTAAGVQVQIKRTGGKKLLRGAFIANRDNQYGGTVFVRRGPKRLPILARQTIHVSQMFNQRLINQSVIEFMREKFPEVFANDVKYFINRFNARKGL